MSLRATGEKSSSKSATMLVSLSDGHLTPRELAQFVDRRADDVSRLTFDRNLDYRGDASSRKSDCNNAIVESWCASKALRARGTRSSHQGSWASLG